MKGGESRETSGEKPSCFGSAPGPQGQAENDCDRCVHVIGCFTPLAAQLAQAGSQLATVRKTRERELDEHLKQRDELKQQLAQAQHDLKELDQAGYRDGKFLATQLAETKQQLAQAQGGLAIARGEVKLAHSENKRLLALLNRARSFFAPESPEFALTASGKAAIEIEVDAVMEGASFTELSTEVYAQIPGRHALSVYAPTMNEASAKLRALVTERVTRLQKTVERTEEQDGPDGLNGREAAQ